MATEAGGTRPLTQLVAGNGQSAVSYTLPAGLYQYIQSVVATIDTTASGDVSPLLTIRDDAGLVVADKQQGAAIDAGGAGRSTWALRLTDEVRARRLHGGGTEGLSFAQAVLSGGTGTDTAWQHDSGDVLLNVTGVNARLPIVRYAGVYTVVVSVVPGAVHAGKFFRLSVDANRAANPDGFASQSAPLDDVTAAGDAPWITCTVTIAMAVGDTFDALLFQGSGGSETFSGNITVQRQELP